eukprot:1141017-Pelagomonas_calceolata.AAC.6
MSVCGAKTTWHGPLALSSQLLLHPHALPLCHHNLYIPRSITYHPNMRTSPSLSPQFLSQIPALTQPPSSLTTHHSNLHTPPDSLSHP